MAGVVQTSQEPSVQGAGDVTHHQLTSHALGLTGRDRKRGTERNGETETDRKIMGIFNLV